MPRRPNPRAESQAAAADELAQEQGPSSTHTPPRVANGFVHATRPDGVAVVFSPGEALPDWAPTSDDADDQTPDVPEPKPASKGRGRIGTG